MSRARWRISAHALHRVDRRAQHRLGERVTFDDAPADQCFEALFRLGQQRRGPGEAHLDRSEIDFARLHIRLIEQRVEERRHTGEESGVRPLNRC